MEAIGSYHRTPPPPNSPLMELLWSFIVGIQGVLEGSWGGLST